MRLDHFIIGIVIFSIVITSSSFIFIDVNDNYDVGMDQTDFRDTYSKINDTYDTGTAISDNSFAISMSGEDQTEDSMFLGAYRALRQTKESYSITAGIITAIADKMGIPAAFVSAAITILSILIGFAILYMLFRFMPR